MDFEFSYLLILDILAISTSLMLGLLFLTIKSENKKANVFLGLFLWSLAIEIIASFLSTLSEIEFDFYEPIIYTSFFTILFLFLYVRSAIYSDFKKWHFALFIPGVLVNGFLFFNANFDSELFRFLEYFFNIGLLLFILNKLKKHRENIHNFYSDLENKTLSWIKAIVFIFLGFYLLWIVEDIVGFQNDNYADYFAMISTIFTFFMVYWIGYNGFTQNEIFKQRLFEGKKIKAIDYSGLSEVSLKKFNTLEAQIIKHKLFKNPNLNLKSLSEELKIKDRELSKLINYYSKTNFYHFINRLRIEEFKILLHSPKAHQLSIVGLAQEAGFSSKSTFYSAFKTIEGITPKEYQLKIQA